MGQPASILPVRIALFGTPLVTSADAAVVYALPRKTLDVLAYLLLNRGRMMQRAAVAFALFPDDEEELARGSLRRNLSYLLSALPEAPAQTPFVLTDGKTIGWNTKAPAALDVDEFERAAREHRDDDAIALYAGELLPTLYAEWTTGERERLRGEFHEVLLRKAQAERSRRSFDDATSLAHVLLNEDPWREDIVRLLIAIRHEAGDRSGALAEYERFASRLRSEMQVEPMPETVAVRDAVMRGTLLATSERTAPAHSTPVSAPQPGLPFVGRDQPMESALARWHMAAEGRGSLLFVTGEAGIGKSRFVTELARKIEREGGSVLRGQTSVIAEHCSYEAFFDALQQSSSGAVANEVFETVRRRIYELTRRRPLAIIVEDLHWAGSDTIALLEFVARGVATARLFIVVTMRTDELPREHALRLLSRKLEALELGEIITLGRLSEDEATAALEASLPRDAYTGAIAQAVTWADGLPLLVMEAVRDVAAGRPVARGARLPLSLSSFIGREKELGDIAALVREYRLVTVTGAGGVGKTQTALQVASAFNDSASGSVRFVSLAPVRNPSLVAGAIATALGVQEAAHRRPIETVVSYLERKATLIVLDNCEHVVGEVARVADILLSRCAGVRILATSREPLKSAGEHAYRLPSLPKSSAVELFIDRARAVDSGFAPVDSSTATVAEICRRLDGIPLAIELAAARVNSLSLPMLFERLSDRFELLTGGTRTAIPRQQTMRAAIEWSYDLLSEPERRLFDRLSVFAGGCTLQMAVSVCADENQDGTLILLLLSSLVDKSLVVSNIDADAMRYALPDTTREYAREKLAERGESQAIAARLASVLLELSRLLAGTETAYNARADRSAATLRTMRAERLNFDEAMDWTLVRRNDVRLGQEMAWRVPFLRATDALHWLCLALESVDGETPRTLIATLQIQLGWCLVDLRDHEKAIANARAAVAESVALDDASLAAAARLLLGRALTHAWRLDEAEVELQKALTSWRKIGDRRAIATALSYLAFAAVRRGAYARARRLNLDALDTLGDSDERHGRMIKTELARAEYGLGNYEVALAYSSEVLPALEAEAAEGGLTCVILMLNQSAFLVALERFDEAIAVARRALTATLDAQNPRPDLVPYVAGALAKIAVLQTEPRAGSDRKARLENCAKLLAWNDAVCIARGESDPDETFEEVALLRRELGRERVRRLLAEGARLDNAAAIELMSQL